MGTTKRTSGTKSDNTKKSVSSTVTPFTSGIAMVRTPTDVITAIRRRAYELFEQRGRQHGHDFDDWLRAEAEVYGHRQARTA